MTREIQGLSQIIDRFDAVLIDQFGVLHDGKTVFDGAIPCLEALRDAQKPVVALTNSGRTKAPNIKRLARLGFSTDLIADVVTSGDLARNLIQNKLETGSLSPGNRVLNLARDGDSSVLDGLGFEILETVEGRVDLVFLSGVTPESHSRDDYKSMLGDLARNGIPAICANPDHMMYANGSTAFGAGIVAEDYQNAGGPVEIIGKPYNEIFEAGLRALGSPPPARTLMIGDSPHHDIAGGAAAGCQTLLISSGVQAGAGVSATPPDFVMATLTL